MPPVPALRDEEGEAVREFLQAIEDHLCVFIIVAVLAISALSAIFGGRD